VVDHELEFTAEKVRTEVIYAVYYRKQLSLYSGVILFGAVQKPRYVEYRQVFSHRALGQYPADRIL